MTGKNLWVPRILRAILTLWDAAGHLKQLLLMTNLPNVQCHLNEALLYLSLVILHCSELDVAPPVRASGSGGNSAKSLVVDTVRADHRTPSNDEKLKHFLLRS